MSKLLDINGYWNEDSENSFYSDDSWFGQILVKDDGIFEGLITLTPEWNNIKGYVFGTYKEDEDITLNAVFLSSVNDPLVYRVKKIENGYYGKFYTISNFFQEYESGTAFIVPSDVEIERKENVELQAAALTSEIDSWKELYMDPYAELLYNDFISSTELEQHSAKNM